eukprot:TRINITY_DN2445_c0_g1_i2.p1 TRINITY_DN2445_c0_g1~~TRINITY_DN2445_c0_g1_i2.p1  ORF type:complete len:365 (-),score=80.30 TRINITY_DN2445_c0_g1_i2:53-1147(-)
MNSVSSDSNTSSPTSLVRSKRGRPQSPTCVFCYIRHITCNSCVSFRALSHWTEEQLKVYKPVWRKFGSSLYFLDHPPAPGAASSAKLNDKSKINDVDTFRKRLLEAQEIIKAASSDDTCQSNRKKKQASRLATSPTHTSAPSSPVSTPGSPVSQLTADSPSNFNFSPPTSPFASSYCSSAESAQSSPSRGEKRKSSSSSSLSLSSSSSSSSSEFVTKRQRSDSEEANDILLINDLTSSTASQRFTTEKFIPVFDMTRCQSPNNESLSTLIMTTSPGRSPSPISMSSSSSFSAVSSPMVSLLNFKRTLSSLPSPSPTPSLHMSLSPRSIDSNTTLPPMTSPTCHMSLPSFQSCFGNLLASISSQK